RLMLLDRLSHRGRADRPERPAAVEQPEVSVYGRRLVKTRFVWWAVQVEDSSRRIGDLLRHQLDAFPELCLRFLAVSVPGRVVRPPRRDHREAVDIHHPTLAEHDHLRSPDDVIHLHLVVVPRAYEDSHA